MDDEVEVRMGLGEEEGEWIGVRLRFGEGVMDLLRFVGRLPKDWDVKVSRTPGTDRAKTVVCTG